jgi:hypothetical protein
MATIDGAVNLTEIIVKIGRQSQTNVSILKTHMTTEIMTEMVEGTDRRNAAQVQKGRTELTKEPIIREEGARMVMITKPEICATL